MRALLVTLAVLFVAGLDVSASPGHQGPTPVDESMFVHFTGQGLALHPTEPTSYEGIGNDATPACGTSLSWQAAFNQGSPTDGLQPGLLSRQADLDTARPKLTWFLHATVPGVGAASPVPLPDAHIVASLRTGADTASLADGIELARAQETLTPTSTSVDGVYMLESRLTWTNDPLLPAGEALQLEISLSFGPEACQTPLPGIAAYADNDHQPRLDWKVYDPVRLDDFRAQDNNGTVTLTLEASSPWGSQHIAPVDDPTVAGGIGPVSGVTRTSIEEGDLLRVTWTWLQGSAPNGTYRADIMIQDIFGAVSTPDNIVFTVGDNREPRQVPLEPEPVKESPGLGIAAVLAVFGVVMKNRSKL